MKFVRSVLRALSVPAALLAMVAAVKAADVPADGGLQLSLSTNAYRVYGGDLVTPVAKAARVAKDASVAKRTLVASAQLVNRSGADLPFTFPDSSAATRKFDFRVLNTAGEQVWEGTAPIVGSGDASTFPANLRKRSKWSATIQIPLKVEDAWLTPGIYTLEASIAGEPKIGATTLFEVVLPPSPPPIDPLPNTGIQGRVLRGPLIYATTNTTTNTGTTVAPVNEWPGVKANIRIVEIFPPGAQTFRAPFTYEGQTAADGTFKVATPTGRFRVTASAVPIVVGANSVTLSADQTVASSNFIIALPMPVETTVTAGKYSLVTLFLSGGYTPPPPPVDSGITGTVLLPAVGDAAAAPAAGATVVIEEVRPIISPLDATAIMLPIRLPFRTVVKADEHGHFAANTPAGKFHVVATLPSVTGGGGVIPLDAATGAVPANIFIVPLRGSADVTVAPGQFSDVTIQLLAGVVEIGTQLVSSVSEVEALSLIGVNSASLRVSARGQVSSGGWSSPTLKYIGTTEGIAQFEFRATPPSGVAIQVISSISATTTLPLPVGAKSVRVLASSNSETATILPGMVAF